MVRLGESGHYQYDKLDDWPVLGGPVHGDGLFVKDSLLILVEIRIVQACLDAVVECL